MLLLQRSDIFLFPLVWVNDFSVLLRFIQNDNFPLVRDKKSDLKSTGGMGGFLVMTSFYGLIKLLRGRSHGLMIGTALFNIIVVILAFLYLKNMPIEKCYNQSKLKFSKAKIQYKPPPKPIDYSLKEQFKA